MAHGKQSTLNRMTYIFEFIFMLQSFRNILNYYRTKTKNQTYECFEVEIAWKFGDIDLKSEFYWKFPLESVNAPLLLVYRMTFAVHTPDCLPKKSFLYVVSTLMKEIPYW